jgi:NhaP-type Na+/H+ or K+/H+ antiporter
MADDEDQAKTMSIVFCIFSLLLAGVLLLAKALHSRPKLNTYLSEPAMVLLVGMVCSYFVAWQFKNIDDDDDQAANEGVDVARSILSFSPNVFYIALLPPILFNSGYELERDMFMRHIKPIVLYACAGTTISGFATGFLLYLVKWLGWLGDFNPSLLELLTFGALIAATDTVSVLGVLKAKRVDPHLFSLVFGESALNDGVAIVLFKTLADMLADAEDVSPLTAAYDFFLDFTIEAIGSPLLGIVFSFLAALVFKHVDFRGQRIIELSLYMLLMYVPFVLAEISYLSGIVTIFFAGMSARRYIEPNLTEETKENAKVIFKLASYLSETCIFLHVGLSIFGFKGSFKWGFIGFAFIAALAGRAMSIYPLSILFNLSLKEVVHNPLLDCDDDSSVGSASTASTGSSMSLRRRKMRRRRKTPAKRKDKVVPFSFMHILWFAGLRGAVAYACAQNFPNVNGNSDTFLAATIIIVLVTVIVMGGATEPLIQYLQIRIDVDEKEYMKEWRSRRKLKGLFHTLGKLRCWLSIIGVSDTVI